MIGLYPTNGRDQKLRKSKWYLVHSIPPSPNPNPFPQVVLLLRLRTVLIVWLPLYLQYCEIAFFIPFLAISILHGQFILKSTFYVQPSCVH